MLLGSGFQVDNLKVRIITAQLKFFNKLKAFLPKNEPITEKIAKTPLEGGSPPAWLK